MLLAADVFEGIAARLTADAPGPVPIVAALAAAVSTTGGGQRRGPRTAVGGRLTVIPFAPGAEGLAGYDFPLGPDGSPQIPLAEPLSVPLRDLSRGGVRFMTSSRLPLDTPFVLLLPRPPAVPETGDFGIAAALVGGKSLPPFAVECAVTYWQPVRRDLFAVGARFRRELMGFGAPSRPAVVVLPGFADPAAGGPARRAG
jgi:hypothetical protein